MNVGVDSSWQKRLATHNAGSVLIERRMRLSQMEGAQEKRMSRIFNTVKELCTQTTPQLAKSASRVWSSAPKQAGTTHVSGGYTIVEVMIVLAITGVIFASSVTIFASRRGSTEFSQAMQDLQSEIQTLSTQIISSNLSSVGSGNYCGLTPSSPPSPYLSSTPTGQNECIYLGRAIQIVPNSTNMYIYPVLGLKDIDGDPANGQPTTPAQANPSPAVDSSGNPILYTTYSLLNGAQFKAAAASSNAAHIVGSSTESDFLALYSSLQSGNISGSDTTASVSTYTAGNVGTPPDFSGLTKCVQQASPCTAVTNLTSTNAWSICVQDASGSRTAGLIVKSSSTGLTTSVNMDTCP